MGEFVPNLFEEQKKTLHTPRRKYGLLAGTLFFLMDLFYGRMRTLSKFKVLETTYHHTQVT